MAAGRGSLRELAVGAAAAAKRSPVEQRLEQGVVPCSNCFVTVDQDRLFVVERFGRFSHTLDPGLSFAGLDCFGWCISLRSMSARTEESRTSVTTRTGGGMITKVTITLQHSVDPQRLQNAMYKTQDLPGQIDAWVANAVNTHWTTWRSQHVPYDIMGATEKQIRETLAPLGIVVHKVIQVYTIPPEVAQAQELSAKLKREIDSVVQAAEAEKAQRIKAAEANADAAALQGKGLARQRAAIVDGLRESINTASGTTLSADEVTELLFITQYFETTRAICSGNTEVIFTGENNHGLQAPALQSM